MNHNRIMLACCCPTTDAVDFQSYMVPSTSDGFAASLWSNLWFLSPTQVYSMQHATGEAGHVSGVWSACVSSGQVLWTQQHSGMCPGLSTLHSSLLVFSSVEHFKGLHIYIPPLTSTWPAAVYNAKWRTDRQWRWVAQRK